MAGQWIGHIYFLSICTWRALLRIAIFRLPAFHMPIGLVSFETGAKTDGMLTGDSREVI